MDTFKVSNILNLGLGDLYDWSDSITTNLIQQKHVTLKYLISKEYSEVLMSKEVSFIKPGILGCETYFLAG